MTRPRASRRLLVAAASLAAALAGCGQGPVADAPDEGSTSTTARLEVTGPGLVRDDEPLLTCGPVPPFPASVLRDGVPGLVEAPDLLAALEGLRAGTGGETSQRLVEADSASDVTARVVGVEEHATGRDVVVLLGDLPEDGRSPDLDVVLLDEQDGRWRARGYGGCEVTPALPAGVTWAEITVPSEGLDRATTSLILDVGERSCASGRDPEPFLREPVVVEDASSVVVSWTTEAARGAQTCIGRAPIRQQLPLAAPLGDRVLLDGRTWPPVQVVGADR